MHYTHEGLLAQLGYNVTPALVEQMERVSANTNGFEHIEKHIIPLNDELKKHLSFIALSGTNNYLKIKNEAETNEIKNEVNEIIEHWSKKYKVKLKKVDGKETYYIIGYDKED